MSKPPKRRTYTNATLATLHATKVQRKRARGFRRVHAGPEPGSMSKVLASYQQLYGKAADKGDKS